MATQLMKAAASLRATNAVKRSGDGGAASKQRGRPQVFTMARYPAASRGVEADTCPVQSIALLSS
jgi:hypothetical protein